MIIKTSELEGAALNWAVAFATNGKPVFFDAFDARMLGRPLSKAAKSGEISPSTDWSQGGLLLDAYKMSVEHDGIPGDDTEATAYAWKKSGAHACAFGENALIAICRAVVWVELGDTVDVPEELLS